MLLCCVDLEIEALNKNIGRWETTWFNCHILHFKCFNLVGYGLYQLSFSFDELSKVASVYQFFYLIL